MLRFILAFVCGAFLPTSCLSQTDTVGASPSPRQASFCDLKHNPTNYDGQWITVRGRVSMEFEDFSLDDPDCNASDLTWIWLTFGGDQDEITGYCCVNPIRKKGVDIEAGGQRVPLVRDEDCVNSSVYCKAQDCAGQTVIPARGMSATFTAR